MRLMATELYGRDTRRAFGFVDTARLVPVSPCRAESPRLPTPAYPMSPSPSDISPGPCGAGREATLKGNLDAAR